MLHELGDLARLANVGSVLHQGPRLRGQAGARALSHGGLCDRLAGGLRPGEATTPGNLIQRAQPIVAEAKGQW